MQIGGQSRDSGLVTSRAFVWAGLVRHDGTGRDARVAVEIGILMTDPDPFQFKRGSGLFLFHENREYGDLLARSSYAG